MKRLPVLTATVLVCVFAGVLMAVAQVRAPNEPSGDASPGTSSLIPLNYLARGVDLALGHNDPLIAAVSDRYLGSAREVVTFDGVAPLSLELVGQTDTRFLDQGVLFEVVDPPVTVGGTMNCVVGGCLNVSQIVPSRVRIRFVEAGTLNPTTVTAMGVWTTTPDRNMNCLEFFDALDGYLGTVCAQAGSYVPITDVEFIGAKYAGGIGYVEAFTPWSTDVGFEIDLLSLAGNPFALEFDSASLTFGQRGSDSYSFYADYELGAGSDGIFPDLESVKVSFGTHTQTIPAGAFVCTGHDCRFQSAGRGITEATITDSGMEFVAEGIDLSDTKNPVNVTVAVGNDSGGASIRLSGTLHLGDEEDSEDD